MTLLELIKKVDEGYSDDILTLEDYYNQETGAFIDNPDGGDGLARFIVIELGETYDEDCSDEEQISEARRVIQNAADDLERTLSKL